MTVLFRRKTVLLAVSLMVSGTLSLMAQTSVWNHAYAEFGQPDSMESILQEARDAYVLLDPFDDPVAATSVASLKAAGNTVAAYISVGTGENWRGDFSELEPFLVDRPWGEWEGEYFLNRVTDEVLAVMTRRLDRIAEWGFDFVEFDNMDWAQDEGARRRYGFVIGEEEAYAYIDELRRYAQSLGLSVMAKNITEDLAFFDGVTLESWANDSDWWDGTALVDFIDSGGLVLVFHYSRRDPSSQVENYRTGYGRNLLILTEGRRGYRH